MIKKITILNSNNLKPIFSIRSLFGSSQSDHLVLENLNIPCFTIDTGTHSDYHTVFDDWNKINVEGIIKITDYTSNIINAFAN